MLYILLKLFCLEINKNMFLNNEEFNIYDVDDEMSIKERIAYSLESTLFWTYIKPNDNKPLVSSLDVTAINILNEMKNKLEDFNSFKDLESYFSYWINDREDSDLNVIHELGKLYILFVFEDLDVNDIENKIILESFLSDAGGSDFDWDFIEKTINKKEFLLDEIRKDILDLKKKVNKKKKFLTQQNYKTLNEENYIKTTNFLITSIVETLNIKTENPIVLTHVLNNLSLDNLLFARYDKFFKVNEKEKENLKKYDYDYEYIKDTLFIVLFSKEGKKYSFREIKITELSPFEFIIDIDTLQEEINIQELENILLDSKITIKSKSNTKIKGEFLILDQTFHKELFLDEIMNNEHFFNLYVNERIKVGKVFSKINIYLYSIKTNNVNFSILNENNNIKIKVSKILSNEYIDFFVNLIIFLFKKYKEKESLLLNIYKKYIPSISLNNERIFDEFDNEIVNVKTKKKITQRNPLALIEPSLFVPLYTRKCAKPPRIVEEGEEISEEYNIMEFPKFNEGGLKTRKYVCDNTGNFRFPGVRKNTLSNNKIFKYIPCCYETNQEIRKKSPLNIYLSGKLHTKNDKYEHILYKTSRVLPNENKGILPTGLTRIFGSEPRRGVFVGPNAFIDCVSRSCNLYTKDILNEKSRIKTLKMLREKMRPEYSAQENTDIQNYISWFKNTDLYFEPRRFFKSVEAFFKVNIYIFERSVNYVSKYIQDENKLEYIKTQNVDGVMSIPNIPKKGVYLDSKRYKRSVFIFVHMGGAVDCLNNPHCEYILNNDSITLQDNVEKIYRNILIHSYKNRYFKGDENYIKYQYADSSGRIIRMLTVNGEQLKFDYSIEPIGVEIKKLEILPEQDILENFIKTKRLARVFVEFCMIKYAQKSDQETIESFIDKYSVIIPNFKYKPISAHFDLEYYKSIFIKQGKLVFDSEDTKLRIIYTMNLLEKRSGLNRYIVKPYIYNYFLCNLDFEDFTLTEQSFKTFAYNNVQGLTMNNFLQEIQNIKLILNKDNLNLNLNGYFGVFNSLNELKEQINTNTFLQTSIYDYYYLFNQNGYNKYIVENGIGRVIIVYKINTNLFYLGKYASL